MLFLLSIYVKFKLSHWGQGCEFSVVVFEPQLSRQAFNSRLFKPGRAWVRRGYAPFAGVGALALPEPHERSRSQAGVDRSAFLHFIKEV